MAGGVGGGLNGMVDPNSVSANGRLGEDDRIGDDLLANAGDIDKLLELGPGGDVPSGPLGIPGVMLEAYMQAEDTMIGLSPNCNLDWPLLASIGRIESNHARNGKVDAEGNTVPQILGPVLNGGGFAAIRDTDGGALDGDNRWDRAVGAMQFIPSTWAGYASDGNDDGTKSPHNVYDATLAAGKYLCSGNMDLSNPQDRATAVFRYNHSDTYVQTVLVWANAYAQGVDPMESDPIDYSEDNDPADYAMGPPSTWDPVPPPAGTTQAPPPPPGGATPPPGTHPSTVLPTEVSTPRSMNSCAPRPSSSPATTPTTTPETTSETTPPAPESSTTTTTTTTTVPSSASAAAQTC